VQEVRQVGAESGGDELPFTGLAAMPDPARRPRADRRGLRDAPRYRPRRVGRTQHRIVLRAAAFGPPRGG
jgi:hypothetical protein